MIVLLLASCFYSDYESKVYISPTGNYFVKASVNRTNEKLDDYSDVIIHIYDKNKQEINKFNSGVGDSNKWSLGWTHNGDTIVLQSSDIGDQSWIIIEGKEKKIELTKELMERAKELKEENYK